MADWSKLKVVDLRAELKRRDLSYAGLKAELVARLEADDQGLTPVDDANGQAPADEGAAEGTEEPAAAGPEPSAGDVEKHKTENNDENPPASQEPTLDVVQNGAHEATPPPADNVALEANEAIQPETTGEAPDASVQASTAVEQPTAQTEAGAELPGPENDQQPQTDESQAAAAREEPAVKETSVESAPDSQKRKRRSASPPPNQEAVARKRARAEEPAEGDIAPAVRLDGQEDDGPRQGGDAMQGVERGADKENADVASAPQRAQTPSAGDAPYDAFRADTGRDVAPALHPATEALYISNLMRPLRPLDVRNHLVDLASAGQPFANEDAVVRFHLDQIRTHAFVIFDSLSAAARVRASLHECVWPNESNRKALWVDFIPPGRVDEWIETEEAGGRTNRSGQRWEVAYEDGPDGIEARLVSSSLSASRTGPPPGPASRPPPTGPARHPDSVNAIPVGPRGFAAPTGPRAVRPGAGPGPRPGPALGGVVEHTQTRPVLTYQTVSDDLASRRLDNMRSFYTRDLDRPLGREINRFSFEEGDSFVDRGKEVFEGIRPPHRERAMRGGGGGGRGGGRGGFGAGRGLPPPRGGGPPPFRPRNDRYFPPGGPGRGPPPPPPPMYHDDPRDAFRDRDFRDGYRDRGFRDDFRDSGFRDRGFRDNFRDDFRDRRF